MQGEGPARAPLTSLVQVLGRLVLRLAILVALAAASREPFRAVLATLLVVAMGLSVAMAVSRREPPFGPTLSHWDEAILYALIGRGLMLANGAHTA